MNPSNLVVRRTLLDPGGVAAGIETLASSIADNGIDERTFVVGIQTGGVHLAHRILESLARRGLGDIQQGVLDITLYRDDIFLGLQQPLVRKTELPFEVDGATIVLVDDVLYTGRTVRAALDALVEFGRPRAVRLAVLVDRGLREYPIQADWAAVRSVTFPSETVQVELVEMGFSEDRVVVYARED